MVTIHLLLNTLMDEPTQRQAHGQDLSGEISRPRALTLTTARSLRSGTVPSAATQSIFLNAVAEDTDDRSGIPWMVPIAVPRARRLARLSCAIPYLSTLAIPAQLRRWSRSRRRHPLEAPAAQPPSGRERPFRRRPRGTARMRHGRPPECPGSPGRRLPFPAP